MTRIDVVGLGPSDGSLVTSNALSLIEGTSKGFVRTRRHPAASLVKHFESFDDVYEKAQRIEDVYAAIVESLVSAATQHGEIVYAVPGSPLVAEHTVELLRDLTDVDVLIHPAMSFLDLIWARVGIDPFSEAVSLVDAHEFDGSTLSGAVCFGQCDSKDVLSDIKLSVENGDGADVWVLQRLGLPDESVRKVQWDDLDRDIEPDHLTSVYVSNYPATQASIFTELNNVVLRLRKECPWDAKQTHLTLTKYLIEESYELIEALGIFEELGGYESNSDERGKALEHVIEELGDVLIQVLMHSAIGTEVGEFTITDVASGLQNKLVHRHPHVFSDVTADTPEMVEANWKVLKEQEGKTPDTDLNLDKNLPSLVYVNTLRGRMKKRGFRNMDVAACLHDVKEEVDELRDALGSSNGEISTEVFNEFGDVLLAAVNLGNALSIDSEAALRATAARFRERFLRFESIISDGKKNIAELSEQELISLWKKAKP